MRLRQTIGEECPRPGISVFHLMLTAGLSAVAGDHSSGRSFSAEMPWPPGPRHCGHWPDALTVTVSARSKLPHTQFPTLERPAGFVVWELGVRRWEVIMISARTWDGSRAPSPRPPRPAGSPRTAWD